VLRLERLPRLSLSGLGSDRSYLFPVGKPLRQHTPSLRRSLATPTKEAAAGLPVRPS
jgi:hypothetical protein